MVGYEMPPGGRGAVMSADRSSQMDYDALGGAYNRTRWPDARIARLIDAALGDAASVVNVGAGSGAYEPCTREVVAVEPSAAMIAARPEGAAPVVQAAAEQLPFPDDAFDAAMGVLTMQHWSDLGRGLREMHRVARRRVVLLTWDPEFEDALWLTVRYLPQIRDRDRVCFPSRRQLARRLGALEVTPVLIPHDCTDGFLGAWWRRPDAYLDPGVRASISGFARIPQEQVEAAMRRLARDLESGEWDRLYGELLELEQLDLGYRLVTAESA
jgi:SAM-dependent methyltransferase